MSLPVNDVKVKRRWFQLHLSTCVVLMFVAGVLLWANVRPQIVVWEKPGHLEGRRIHGVPWAIREVNLTDKGFGGPVFPSHAEWHPWHGACNAAVALAILAVTAMACEWLIRRRMAPKDAR